MKRRESNPVKWIPLERIPSMRLSFLEALNSKELPAFTQTSLKF